MPSEAAARQLAQRWIDAWNSHDVDAILELYADDVEFTSPFVANITGDASGVIRGKAELRTFFVRVLGAYPDLRYELDGVAAGIWSIAIVYRSVDERLGVEVMQLEGECARRVLAHYGQR
jgi:steroid delta-isomerase-like uncharacterized protein